MTPRSRERRVYALVALVLLAGALFLFRGALFRLVAVAARPFSAAGTWTADRVAAWCEEEDAESLRRERDALAVDRAELAALRNENAELRAQLGFVDGRTERAVTAAIVARESTDRAAAFVIDRGSRDGLRLGQPVIAGGGLLLGKISRLTATTATVTPTADPASATAAALLNEARTIGLAEGAGGALMTLSYIPNDVSVRVNDLVVTSGLEDGMAPNLVVGIVNDVTADETAPFQTAVIEPLSDARRLSIVTVLVTESL